MKVKTILVSQPRPKLENSPFFDLQKKRKVKIDFVPFIHVKGATVKEIRLQKIDLTKFSAIILTSRYAVDHYFRICEKMRFKVPVSQPRPKLENSPFFDLQKKRKVKIDFVPFIHVKGATVKEIRLQKIDLTKFSAIILTSRYAVDHYFRICEKMRFKVPDSMKYFCQSEAVAFYLQKYVVYRKRKIYVGKRSFADLCPIIGKHNSETFLLPTTNKLKPEVPNLLNSLEINWKQSVFYKTVISDLSEFANVTYDVLVFFSPSGIESLIHNFPDFKQNNTRIAVFGAITKKAVEENGLKVDIFAPSPKFPSMSMALDSYIAKANKR